MTSLNTLEGQRLHIRPSQYLVSAATKREAAAYQRQGLTLTEISLEMGFDRDVIVQALYADLVRS